MTIRNLDHFMNSLWDWAILDGCFGDTRIKPSDIDGHVERNGMFLFLEGKRFGSPVPKGQSIMYKRHVQQGNHVALIWGSDNTPQKIQWMYPVEEDGCVKIGTKTYEQADVDLLRRLVSRWFSIANTIKADPILEAKGG